MRKHTLIAVPLIAVAFIASAESCDTTSNSSTTSDGKQTITVKSDAPGGGSKKDAGPTFTPAQENAIKAAKNYVSFSPFSKAGLVEQLSSKAGDGYPPKVARFAVNHLDVDYDHEAYLAAKNYLDMSSFSLAGLEEQLESSAGDKYTHEQAVFGATKAYKGK